MVSVVLLGISSLALATMMAEHSRFTVMTRNHTQLAERLVEFENLFDLYFSNATRILSCGCGNNLGQGCIYDEALSPDCATAVAGCDVGLVTPILSFETEDSTDPSARARADCYTVDAAPAANSQFAATPGVPNSASGGLTMRGCKERYSLFLRQPVAITGTVIPPPGMLVLRNVTTGADVARLEGVYSFRCGHEPTVPGGTIPGQQLFNYRIAAKARKYNGNSTNTTYFESWHPADGANFSMGVQRELSGTIAFRNINTYGVHFGKAITNENCAKDGVTPAAGVACCSGYWQSNVCISADPGAATRCVSRGGATLDTPEGALACCSHRRIGTECL
ncbi:MAG: hypothetical protein IT285_06290 [Bdellovibrionales bacterium]|nr:hypothetical protein [Bdellovibrionales bacterium]